MSAPKAIVAGFVFAVSAVVAVVFLAPGSQTSSGLTEISTPERLTPIAHAPGANVRLIANHDGRAFYRFNRPESPTCFGFGELNAQGEVVPGTELCLQQGIFPSPNRPVLASMGVEIQKRDMGNVTIRSLDGFAADGVAEVQLVRRDGSRVAWTIVTQNSFRLPVARARMGEGAILIATDAGGNEVYRQEFRPRSVG
jgi:hypothetical protein